MPRILFKAIRFSIRTQFCSIWRIVRTLSGATTPSQSGPGSDCNGGALGIPQNSSITGTSPSDWLVSCLGYSLAGGCLSFLQRSSRCIQQPQPIGQRKEVFPKECIGKKFIMGIGKRFNWECIGKKFLLKECTRKCCFFSIRMQWKEVLLRECIRKMFYYRNTLEWDLTIGMNWKDVSREECIGQRFSYRNPLESGFTIRMQ